jgi:enoyl-CoA hydratase/carnithine racemase
MEEKLAHYEIEDQVAIVTIDHPPMNALDIATKEYIGKIFGELDARRQEIRAVILHGAGEKAFAAGADIKTFLELTPDTAKKRLSRSHELYAELAWNWPYAVTFVMPRKTQN